MNIDDIKIDFEELERQKQKNLEDRIAFVHWWADRVNKNPESAFKQHAEFLNNLMGTWLHFELTAIRTYMEELGMEIKQMKNMIADLQERKN